MDGFAIISREKHMNMSRTKKLLQYIMSPKELKKSVGNVGYADIHVPEQHESYKLRQAIRLADKISGIVVSKDYNINYSMFCYYSMLIRALDFYSISIGCDLRLNEVVIGDAATTEGISAFKLLCPIARRIILVTSSKYKVMEIAEGAMVDYGISAAVIEDPLKASEKADAVVLASDNMDYAQLLTKDRPTLIMRFPKRPSSGRWFDDAGTCFMDREKLEETAIQGYLLSMKRNRLWNVAEKEGFEIETVTQQGRILLNR